MDKYRELREKLIIALASNCEVTHFQGFKKKESLDEQCLINAAGIITQADAIITMLELEKR